MGYVTELTSKLTCRLFGHGTLRMEDTHSGVYHLRCVRCRILTGGYKCGAYKNHKFRFSPIPIYPYSGIEHITGKTIMRCIYCGYEEESNMDYRIAKTLY